MRALAVAAALLLGPAHAQHNDVERRNAGHLWLEPTGHPNGHSFPDARQNPPEHQSPTGGVPRGTLSYAWIPAPANDHGEDEVIDGFRAPLGPSSATTVYPAFLYYPELQLHRTRTSGGHVEPDPGATPYYVLAEASLVFPAFGYYESGSNLLAPVPLPAAQRDVVLSLRWNRDDSRWRQDTLQMWGDAYGTVYSEPVFGFVAPAGAVTAVPMTGPQPGHLNLTYRRTAPSVQARSDWGRSHLLLPGLYGTNISTYEAPLASTAGMLGWELAAGAAHSSALAVPLLNVGGRAAAPTPFLGQSIELDPLDPAVAALAAAGYLLPLDPGGFARGPLVPIPALGAGALGLHIGVELLVLDPGATAVVASSQAAWVRVNR